jgi:DNA invertase Pin-like site-specific DNA recombinase
MSTHYGKFIAYFRVSTDRQGKSGLGLEAQRDAVMNYLNGGRWALVDEFTEIESGKRNDRPELEKACRKIDLGEHICLLRRTQGIRSSRSKNGSEACIARHAVVEYSAQAGRQYRV